MADDEEFETNEIKVRAPLTMISAAYLEQAEAFIADAVFPRVGKPLTPLERREQEMAALRRKQELEREYHDHMLGLTHAMAVQGVSGSAWIIDVLELHKPRIENYDYRLQCAGCEYEGWEAEPPSWPCATVRLIANKAGYTGFTSGED